MMSDQTMLIRPDMFHDRRDAPQHYSAQYLDKFLLKAFTARTDEEALEAERTLADIQEQCLKHIRFLSEIESFYRTTVQTAGFDHDEDGYNNVINFIADIGASLAGVTHQLGFSGAVRDVPDVRKGGQ